MHVAKNEVCVHALITQASAYTVPETDVKPTKEEESEEDENKEEEEDEETEEHVPLHMDWKRFISCNRSRHDEQTCQRLDAYPAR